MDFVRQLVAEGETILSDERTNEMSNGLKAQVATLPESRRAALTEYVVRMLAGAGIHAGAEDVRELLWDTPAPTAQAGAGATDRSMLPGQRL